MSAGWVDTLTLSESVSNTSRWDDALKDFKLELVSYIENHVPDALEKVNYHEVNYVTRKVEEVARAVEVFAKANKKIHKDRVGMDILPLDVAKAVTELVRELDNTWNEHHMMLQGADEMHEALEERECALTRELRAAARNMIRELRDMHTSEIYTSR